MLGNHNLSLAVQSLGELRDIAGQAAYTNLTRRLDWGVGVEYVPYLYAGGISSGVTLASDGTPVIVDSYTLLRQTDAAAFGVAAYPFTRAERFELQGTLRRFGFSQELRTEFYDGISGRFLGDDRENVASGDSVYLASVSGALVHDTSVFGATSPILGTRARLEVGANAGSLTYYDTLVDGRAYFMPLRPFTFAVRALHFGRYGPGAGDQRFRSLYLGYPELIRGYGDISVDECEPDGSCPFFERLFGSRMLVANAELRAPLLGLVTGRLTYGPLPLEVAVFADAGVAWSAGSKPSLFGGDRDFLTSVGAALRANVMGFLVAEVSYARPFERENKGWVWQWSLSPGF
jgi:hypothetical protein